jgi:hypothetical protein
MDVPSEDLRGGFGALFELRVRLENEVADAVLGRDQRSDEKR